MYSVDDEDDDDDGDGDGDDADDDADDDVDDEVSFRDDKDTGLLHLSVNKR